MNTENLATTNPTLANKHWQAVLQRDSRCDGQFVFAVKTTGIYCRPSCPARRPKRENTAFFNTAAAAQQAGFRACQRCHPNAKSIAQRHLSAVKNPAH